ncbi:MAG: hypothetical protein Q8P80_03765 [Candidatus Levybacteria bacterium]|nr:hypothetical protein [Candidatus Levybacteria bacterium]
MNQEEIFKIIKYIISECNRLKNKYVDEKNLEVDYVCIFSQNKSEFNQLHKAAESLGKIVDETPMGPVFAFSSQPKTIAGSPKLLKIRKPDATRTQRGDVDFNTDYPSFKSKYLDNKAFTLIMRENFEMIELKDNSFDVLVYFSSTSLSKQLGII